MYRRIFASGCLLTLFFAVGASAQKVKYDGKTYVYIDCSTLIGPKRTVTFAPHNETSVINRLRARFAVSRTDVKEGGLTGCGTVVWAKAVAACAAYKGPKGNEEGLWRLPTQRELKLIWSCRRQLGLLRGGVFAPFADSYYWTATEYSQSPAYAWVVNFDTGGVGYGGKKYAGAVRCVKDL